MIGVHSTPFARGANPMIFIHFEVWGKYDVLGPLPYRICVINPKEQWIRPKKIISQKREGLLVICILLEII